MHVEVIVFTKCFLDVEFSSFLSFYVLPPKAISAGSRRGECPRDQILSSTVKSPRNSLHVLINVEKEIWACEK